MIVCTRDCLPFHVCQFSDKQRKRVVCQYAEPSAAMARRLKRDNEKWVKAMLEKTFSTMQDALKDAELYA
jgi:predicted amidophosphoribosyltransferase